MEQSCIWDYTSVQYLSQQNEQWVKMYLQNKTRRYNKLNEITDYDEFKEFGLKFLNQEQMLQYFQWFIENKETQYFANPVIFTHFKNMFINITNTNETIILFENIFPIKMSSGTITFRDNGLIHRKNDMPSLITYTNGVLDEQWWYTRGKVDRKGDLPAFEKYYTNGAIKYQRWYKDGLIHRDNDKPALLSFYPNGQIKKQKWFKNGKSERDSQKDLPSEIKQSDTGFIIVEKWYCYNKLHRRGGPAWIEYYQGGTKSMERWYNCGLLHKGNGAAVVRYYANGEIKCEEIWIDGLNHSSYKN